jgi:hypothetical protein
VMTNFITQPFDSFFCGSLRQSSYEE